VWPALLDAISGSLNTNSLVESIKMCQNLDEKVQMWLTLKELAFGIVLLSMRIYFPQTLDIYLG
jgi:translation elongation factor EF-1beta